MSKRVIQSRKIKVGDDHRQFDQDFWSKTSPETRFAAMWDAVLDLVRMGRLDASQLRLRRTVTHLQR